MITPSKEFIESFKKTPGAISVCESLAIAWLACQVPDGLCVDIGSNAGKAAMSAAFGLSSYGNRELWLVDPIYDLMNLKAWEHTIQGHPDKMPWDYVNDPLFKEKVKERISFASNTYVHPVLIGDYSTSVLSNVNNKYGYVFLDSDDHQFDLVMGEVKLLEDKMVQGGIIAFHDYGNQYIAPRECADYLLNTGKYEPIEIPWAEIMKYVYDNNLEEGNSSWHMPGVHLPCFVGAVRRK